MIAPPILATRRALVVHLKDDAAVTALLPAPRIFGERAQNSAWPFSRCGEFEGDATGIDGNVHVFSKEEWTDEVNSIVEAMAASLDGTVLHLSDGTKANVSVVRTRVIPDGGEQNAWHGIIRLRMEIARDCAQP